MPITLNGDTGITTPSYGGADAAEYLVPVTAFKNRLINGNMAIDQRNNGASINPTNGQYSLDRWECAVNVSNKMTVQQVNSAPSGFSYSLRVTSSSAYSIGAGEVATIRQKIEGFNMADFAWGTSSAQTVTLSFWVRSSLTGTFSGILSNDNDRSYAFTYTINAANTWEQKSVTITGPTNGTFGATNGLGVVVLFTLAAGSNFVQAAGSWQNANNYGATGTTNLLGTNGATWQVTGTQLEVGTNATSFDARSYGTELQLCQRYFQRFGNVLYAGIASGVQGDTTYSSFTLLFTCPMRIAPTMTFLNLIVTERAFFDSAVTSTSFVHISPNGAFMALNHVSSGAYGRGILLCVSGAVNGYINFNSEL